MNFDKQYLAVSNAMERHEFEEACNIYVELLQSDKGRIVEINHKHEIGRRIHYRLASQYALQKILIQRLKGYSTISPNLDLFTQHLPMRIRYDSVTTDFLDDWKKETSKAFTTWKSVVQQQYTAIIDKYLGGKSSQKAIDADVYFATWVVPDFLNMESFLPE